MTEMKVNDMPLSDYGAKLLAYEVDDSDRSDGYILPSSRIIPVKLRSKISLRTISVLLDFEGTDLEDITMKISDFTAQVREKADLILPDGFCYWCEYEGASAPENVAPWIMQVKFNFSGFRHGPLMNYYFSKTTYVMVKGNYETPAIITVTPDPGVSEFTVCGIKVVNVKGPVTIDGIRTTITENGKNKFKDAPGMTSWPLLQPGSYQIPMTAGVKVKVEFYPIYQ